MSRSLTQMERESRMEVHQPQHPLPKEIQEMPRDDTVCRFCGVSYLIHSEIKSLERQIVALEKQVAYLRDCEQKWKSSETVLKQYEEQRSHLENELTALKANLAEAERNLSDLTENNNSLQSKFKALQVDYEALEDAKGSLHLSMKNKETKQAEMVRILSRCAMGLQEQRHDMEETALQLNQFRESFQHSFAQANEMIKEISIRSEGASQQLTETNRILTEENEELKQKVEGHQAEMAQLRKDMEEKINRLIHAKEEETRKLRDVEERNAQLRSENEVIVRENSGYFQKLGEVDDRRIKSEQSLKEREMSLHFEINRLMKDTQEKDRKFESLKAQSAELELELCGKLEKLEERLLMKDETIRELEQLLDAETERQQEIANSKLIEELGVLQRKHNQELKELEDNRQQREANLLSQFRDEKYDELENCKYQLQKEYEESFIRQRASLERKHREELSSLRDELELKYQKQIQQYESKFSTATNDRIHFLEEQIDIIQQRATQKEHDSKKRIDQLNEQNKKLREELDDVQGNRHTHLEALREDLFQKSKLVQEFEAKLRDATYKFDQKHQEVVFLQDTVRRECEERRELTEALAEAREELLKLKMPPGGYSSRRSTPAKSGNKLVLESINQPRRQSFDAQSDADSQLTGSSSRARKRP